MTTQLNAKQLRDLAETQQLSPIKHRPLYLILDNIYDTYNIGGLFRLADALAMERLYICGDSETPPNHRIQKASVGTYKVVEWRYRNIAMEAIEELREEVPQIQIVSIELTEGAIPYTAFDFKLPCALVVGNETFGVSEAALKASDAVVKLPMYGYNTSLNVIVSAAVVAYEAVAHSKK